MEEEGEVSSKIIAAIDQDIASYVQDRCPLSEIPSSSVVALIP